MVDIFGSIRPPILKTENEKCSAKVKMVLD